MKKSFFNTRVISQDISGFFYAVFFVHSASNIHIMCIFPNAAIKLG